MTCLSSLHGHDCPVCRDPRIPASRMWSITGVPSTATHARVSKCHAVRAPRHSAPHGAAQERAMQVRSRAPCASLRCAIIRSDCPVYPLRTASRQLSSGCASPTGSPNRALPHGSPRPPGARPQASQSPEKLVLRTRTQLNQRSTLLQDLHVCEPHLRESKERANLCICSPPRG